MSGGIVKTEEIEHFFTLVQETHALSIYICWIDIFAPTKNKIKNNWYWHYQRLAINDIQLTTFMKWEYILLFTR
jgi:hypothetical protein